MFGLYLHIPFCAKACVYCNFHFSTLLKYKPEVLAAMHKELELRVLAGEFSGHTVRSIYFGGGTPGLLSIAELASLLEKIHQAYPVSEQAEITLELNPENVSEDLLTHWLKLGVNRFSLGIQSFCDIALEYLGRGYTGKEARRAVEILLAKGCKLSCDVILGIGVQDAKPIRHTLELLLRYQVPHIAAYLLTVEPKTMLDNWIRHKRIAPLCEERQGQDFLECMDYLGSQGYEQYELSNYALAGQRALHNSGYWHGIPYLGIGPGAHSYDGNRRRSWNVANNAHYIKAIAANTLPKTEEYLDERNLYNEYIMHRLRLIEGIDLADMQRRFASDYMEHFYAQMTSLNPHWFCYENNTFALTKQGKLFADTVTVNLMH